MRLFPILIPALISLNLLVGCSANRYAVKVNGEQITDEDIDYEVQQSQTQRRSADRGAAVDRLIKYRLALQEAKKLKLAETPEVRREMEKVLYKAYLDKKLADVSEVSNPTEVELVQYYDEWPWMRVRDLVLFTRGQSEKFAAQSKVSLIQEELRNGVEFRDLVMKYSQDASTVTAGDLDYRAAYQLPPMLYDVAIRMKNGEISSPIEMDGGIHFIELIDRKPFADAPATYKQALRSRFIGERRNAYFSGMFSDLQKDSALEYPLNDRPLATKREVQKNTIGPDTTEPSATGEKQ